MPTPTIIELAQWIADFLRRNKNRSFTKRRLCDILGKDVHKATFYDALDLAKDNYTIVSDNNGHHYARSKQEWLEYCEKIEKENIRTYTKARARRRLDPARPPKEIIIRPVYQGEMMFCDLSLLS